MPDQNLGHGTNGNGWSMLQKHGIYEVSRRGDCCREKNVYEMDIIFAIDFGQ